jgi:competence protein ComEC
VAPELFDYARYLALRGIYHELKVDSAGDWKISGAPAPPPMAEGFRSWAQRTLARGLPVEDEPLRLQWAMLLGWQTALTSEVSEPFMRSGTMHIFAISGLHIALIAGIFLALLRALAMPRLPSGLAVVSLIWFYTAATGWQASAIRSTVMMSVIILGSSLKRPSSLLNSLAAAACVILVWQPEQLFQAGFQLSFFATLGLILYAEPFSVFTSNLIARFSKADTTAFARILNDNVVLTFAAQLTTIPIMAYHFKRISLISFIANPFVLPVQPAVMILSGLAMLVSHIFFPLGQLLAWIAWPFAAYTIRMVELFDQVPHASIYLGDSPIWIVIAFYIALFAVTFKWPALKDWFLSLKSSLRAMALTGSFAFLFICMVLIWRASASSSGVTSHGPMELAKSFPLAGPRRTVVSSRCRSRALQSLKTR